MKLKELIKKLENIQSEHGGNLEVTMADYIPVVDPVISLDKYLGDKVVITDQK